MSQLLVDREKMFGLYVDGTNIGDEYRLVTSADVVAGAEFREVHLLGFLDDAQTEIESVQDLRINTHLLESPHMHRTYTNAGIGLALFGKDGSSLLPDHLCNQFVWVSLDSRSMVLYLVKK